MSNTMLAGFSREEAGPNKPEDLNGFNSDAQFCSPSSLAESLPDQLTPTTDFTSLEPTRLEIALSDNDNETIRACPIAICGIAMRLPGGVRNGDDFWDLIANGRDARSKIPSGRYNAEGFGDSLGDKESIKTKHGYFLDEDLSRFDPSFFSMTKQELEKCDPQQRLLLEVTRECFEDAAEVTYRGQPIGCYVGTFGDDWIQYRSKEPQNTGNYTVTGSGDYMMANRVSYEYDLRGPRYVICFVATA